MLAEAPVMGAAGGPHQFPRRPEELIFDRCLGRGLFGEVWRASEAHGRKAVYAVKKVRTQFLAETGHKDLLRREIDILYSLKHPRIIKLHFHFEDATSVYLGLEFAKGGSLFDKLSWAGKFNSDHARKYFFETCEALDYLHHLPEKVIHRDIKPENILLDAEDHIKLADFGWANLLQGNVRDTFCGTLDYLAPEMIQAKSHDESVDMWNMGVLLYELTTGQAPFHSACKETTFHMITTVEIRFPPDLDSNIQDLILKLCRAEGSKRLKVREAMRHPFLAPLAGPQHQASQLESLTSEGMDVGARGLLKERERMAAEKDTMVKQLERSQNTLRDAKTELAEAKSELQQERADRTRIEDECKKLQSKLDGLMEEVRKEDQRIASGKRGRSKPS
mmetsp:Transcript_55150/g.129120  ORF Transcript_55150/g.129120 Transcript_55150/m.129120 type:complete len:391 (-) Transcript_55150:155-1327(-)